MSNCHYHVKRHTASISVSEFVEKFIDIETFMAACKACPNYDKLWSCPPYDFDVLEYWGRYRQLQLVASQIIFDEDALNKTYTKEEMDEILKEVVLTEKGNLSDELMEEEKKYPGSISLSAGSCHRCTSGCSKACGKPCRFPDTIRYSIESLGGNVGLTIEKLMGIRLEWIEEGHLPHHFVLVSGLLLP